MPRTRYYRDGVLRATDFPVGEISDCLAEPDAVVWLDLCDPQPADFDVVREEFGLHELAVEDAVKGRQRPKVDRYARHAFLNAYSVRLDRGSGELAVAEVAAFVLPKALITVRRTDRFDIEQVTAAWDRSPELARFGVAFLLHGLLDVLVDSHFAAVEALDEQIEGLEDTLFDEASSQVDVQRRSFELRKSLVLLRRVVLPMREVVNTLMRRETDLVQPDLYPYYQDVYDHVLRATEWTESLRDLVTTILETNLTIQGNRLNVITKKVTGWAAIIAVPTAITGFYGQNLPYPGFGQEWGFGFATGLMILLSYLLYRAFRRRDWL